MLPKDKKIEYVTKNVTRGFILLEQKEIKEIMNLMENANGNNGRN